MNELSWDHGPNESLAAVTGRKVETAPGADNYDSGTEIGARAAGAPGRPKGDRGVQGMNLISDAGGSGVAEPAVEEVVALAGGADLALRARIGQGKGES